MWDTSFALVSAESHETGEDARIGKYLLMATDDESVKALRLLVESGRLDLARTMAMGSKARKGTFIVAALHGSSTDHVALGFVLGAEKGELEAFTENGKKPL